MRVARIIAKLEPGGAQLGVLRLMQRLAGLGLDQPLLAGEATPEGLALCAERGIRVEVFGGSALQYDCDPAFARWLEPRLRDADLVHGHMFGAWWAGAQAVLPGVPLVASEHNAIRWPSVPRETELRNALGRVNRFFAHGPATNRYMLSRGLSPVRIEPGFSAIGGHAVAALPGLVSPRVVYAGRLHREKGPDLLLEALALTRSRPAAYVLGTGPMEPELRALSLRLGMEERVAFCGWQRTPGSWIRGADACIVPSRHESWSQAAVLAMALGTPVIGAAVEGLPTTLGEGRGTLVEPDDPVDLARAIDDAIQGRATSDVEGARRYAARFSAARVAEGLLATYRGLIAERYANLGDASLGAA